MGGVEGRDFDVFMSEVTVTMSNDLQEFAYTNKFRSMKEP
jgi:hypothetical protein